MRIALLHAYRTANRGDGWLVELSKRLVRDATGTNPEVYALDPAGMGPNAHHVIRNPLRTRAALIAAASTVPGMKPISSRLVNLPNAQDLTAAIGIGGGYLRCMDPVHEAILRAHHMPQLDLIAAMGSRGAYLPVSIGPFRPRLGKRVRNALGRAAWVCTRDDPSTRYLGARANSVRIPDLAACMIGVERNAPVVGEPGVIGVALRSLHHSSIGLEAIKQLGERGYTIRFGIQSNVGRTNSDDNFYRSQGIGDDLCDFGTMLATAPTPSVVIAGRLHGALEAVASGFPTVHLGYERKSDGAFSDLGLGSWVVDAWGGTATDLVDRVESLVADPSPYWDQLSANVDSLAGSWYRLADMVAGLCGASQAHSVVKSA